VPRRTPGRLGLLDPVAAQMQTTLFRALAVLRVVVACYAVVLFVSRWRDFERPLLGWAVVGVVVAWTVVAGWAYDAPRRRTTALLALDLAVTAGTLLATPWVEGEAMLARHAATLPSFWVVAAVLAWAIARGWPGGVGVAVVVSVLDLSARSHPTGTTWGNIFLLLLAGGVVGYSADLVAEASQARADAERVAAALAERARLARAVHDGVLQVLALVQRRGVEAGGEAAELGRLAGEQEVALRALVQGASVTAGTPSLPAGEDLIEPLTRLASDRVTVSGPAAPVRLSRHAVVELTAAVRACLDNVSRHAGAPARAWVLVEDRADAVAVTVRDDGAGIAPGRLEQAVAEGRMGVDGSIRGRLADLGGTAELVTAPGEGTEWRLVVPAHPAPGQPREAPTGSGSRGRRRPSA
jgi:signal transduction histidine kinase